MRQLALKPILSSSSRMIRVLTNSEVKNELNHEDAMSQNDAIGQHGKFRTTKTFTMAKRIAASTVLLALLATVVATIAIDLPASAQYGQSGDEDRRAQNLALVGGDGTITVTWDPPSNADGLTFYFVQWREKGDTNTLGSASIAVRNFDGMYVIGSLTNYSEYEVRILSIGSFGTAGTAWFTSAQSGDEDRRVRNLTLVGGDGTITVTWDPPSNATGVTYYTVHWREKGAYTLLGNLAIAVGNFDGMYVIDSLTNYSEYEVRILSTGSFGTAGTARFTGVPSEGPLTAPAAPLNVTVAPGINSLDISWAESVVTGNNAPTNYKVDWNPGADHDNGTATSYTIPNLTAGTTYSVRIRAENGAGGAWSSSVSDVPVSGPQVTDIAVSSIDDNGATIDIRVANPDATQQTVYYCIIPTDRTCSGTEIQNRSTPSPHTSIELTPNNLAANTAFVVSASLDTNMVNNVETARFTTHGPPDTPILSIAPDDGQLHVSWSVNLNGGTILSQGQLVEWKLDTAASFTDAFAPDNDARRHTIPSLTNGTDYTVQVSVQTEYGTTSSDEVTRAPAPGPTVSDIIFSNIQQTFATAAITVINLNLATGDVAAHLRYRVQGATDDDWSEPVSQSVSRSSSTRTVNFNLSGLAGNTDYEVQAVTTEGAAEPNWTESFQQPLMTLPSPPHAPTVTFTHGNGQLTVDWTAPTNDGGSPVTGYVVQWKSGTQSYAIARQENTDETGTTVTIPDLNNGTEYTVQIYATNESGNGSPAEDTATPSTVPGTAPQNILASECNSSIHLSWQGPIDNGGNAITSYTIQWKSGDEMFDDMATPARQIVTGNPDLMHTLESLTNGTEYSIRILATNINGDASREVTDDMMVTTTELIWSDDELVTPREGSCISDVKFGNTLADSAPVIADVKDAEDGTDVYMRYRQTNPGDWSETQHKTVNAGDTTVTFDARDLQPETEYETEVSTDPGFEPRSTTRAFFTTGKAPTGGITGGGGGSLARILRIERTIRSVTVSPGDRVQLGVDVYGAQDIKNNSLGDDVTFDWGDDGAGGEFDGNGREVTYTAPDRPGSHTISVAAPSAACRAPATDEVRCAATFDITVRRSPASVEPTPLPVNPAGTIPTILTDPDGNQYEVFTPEDGGTFTGDTSSLNAGSGAVPNGEIVGLRIAEGGSASNEGKTYQRYTLGGNWYEISAVDASNTSVSSYGLNDAVEVCIPLPNELRSNISGLSIVAINADETLTVLSSRVRISTDAGANVCGGISSVPATVAVGTAGSPAPLPTAVPEEVSDLPDTGGAAPSNDGMLWALILGSAIMVSGYAVLRSARRRNIQMR